MYAGQYNGVMVWLAVAGVLNSALSLYYYARVIGYMYIEESTHVTPLKVPASMNTAVALALLGILVTGILAGPFIYAAQQAGSVFFTSIPLFP